LLEIRQRGDADARIRRDLPAEFFDELAVRDITLVTPAAQYPNTQVGIVGRTIDLA
jgi:hypothetical protein